MPSADITSRNAIQISKMVWRDWGSDLGSAHQNQCNSGVSYLKMVYTHHSVKGTLPCQLDIVCHIQVCTCLIRLAFSCPGLILDQYKPVLDLVSLCDISRYILWPQCIEFSPPPDTHIQVGTRLLDWQSSIRTGTKMWTWTWIGLDI